MRSLSISLKGALIFPFLTHVFAIPAQESFFNIAARDTDTPDLQFTAVGVSQVNGPAFTFNRSIRDTGIYVLGNYTTSLPPTGNNTFDFLRQQSALIYNGRQKVYDGRDGHLPGDGVWISTNPKLYNLGLYVRPMENQLITFLILQRAIWALQDTTLSSTHPAFTGYDAIPAYARRAFTFDIMDARWGHVGQAVLASCEAGSLHCFAEFGLPNV